MFNTFVLSNIPYIEILLQTISNTAYILYVLKTIVLKTIVYVLKTILLLLLLLF